MNENALQWSFNPWRERTRAAVLGCAAMVAIVALLLASRLWAASFIVLLMAVNSQLGPTFLPMRFQLDADGVRYAVPIGWARRPWSDFRRAVLRPEGLLLSPGSRPSRFESFRSLFLPFPAASRDRLVPQVRQLVAEHGL